MECGELEELLPAYALNALAPGEAAAVDRHLDTCSRCPALLAEHVEVASALAQAVESLEPPPRLRDRTVRRLPRPPAPERRQESSPIGARHIFVGALGGAGLLLVSAALAIGVYMAVQIEDLEAENVSLAAKVSLLAEEEGQLMDMFVEQRSMSYILALPDKEVLPLQGGEKDPEAQGILMIAGGGSGLLMAKGLEPTSQEEPYYVWLRTNGDRVVVGRLSVDQRGWGVLTMWPDRPIDLFQQVWVTEGPVLETASTSRGPVLWGTISAR